MKDLIKRILKESLTSKDIETYDEMNKFVVDKDIHNVNFFKQNFRNEFDLSLKKDWLLRLAIENDFDDLGDYIVCNHHFLLNSLLQAAEFLDV